MTTFTTPTSKPHTSYRHEAFFYRSRTEYVSGITAFLAEAITTGQPVMAALTASHAAWVQDALGAARTRVHFVDMTSLGGNPARIIPAWRQFLDRVGTGRRPARGVGEPVWPGRHPAEVSECELHEALLNLAIEPDTPFWLRCPYDVDALAPGIIAEAHRTHPALVTGSTYRGSNAYGGVHHAHELVCREFPQPVVPTESLAFGAGGLSAVSALVSRQAIGAGLSDQRTRNLTLGIHEIATNSVRHGGGGGVLRVWRELGSLVCEVSDHGHHTDPLVGRRTPHPGAEAGRGLWIAHQLCDLVQIRSTPRGSRTRTWSWL